MPCLRVNIPGSHAMQPCWPCIAGLHYTNARSRQDLELCSCVGSRIKAKVRTPTLLRSGCFRTGRLYGWTRQFADRLKSPFIHPSAVPGLRIIHVSCLTSHWLNCQICKLIRLLTMTVARRRQGKPRKRCTYLMAGRKAHISLIHNHTYPEITQSTQGRIEIDQSIGIRVYHFSFNSQNRAIG
jgi:hypothetical protein